MLFFSCLENDIDESKTLIKSISFVGIPDKDVTIDQRTRTIMVQIPSILPDGGLVPKFELSRNAEVREGLTPSGKIILTPYCRCIPSGASKQEARLLISLKTTGPDYPPTTTYRVLLSPPGGCLEAIDDLPITYTRPKDDSTFRILIHLPVKNLYTNPLVHAIFLKNKETGKIRQFFTVSAGFCLNSCDEEQANRLTYPFPSGDVSRNLPSGNYEVSIETGCNNAIIKFSQPLVYTK